MSSPKYASPLVLQPKTSRLLICLVMVAHVGAMLIVVLVNLYWALKLVLLVVLAVSLVFFLRGKGLGNLSSLTWKDGGEWVLELDGDKQYEMQLLPSSYVSPWLVVLNFRAAEEHKGKSVVLFRDALDPESFRRLRVRLGVEKTSDP